MYIATAAGPYRSDDAGSIEFQDGHLERITIPYLLAVPEMTLRLLGLSVSLMALGWLVARL